MTDQIVTLTIQTRTDGVDASKTSIANLNQTVDGTARSVDAATAKYQAHQERVAALSSGLGTLSDHLAGIQQKLDLTSRAAGAAGLAMDAVGWAPAAAGADQLSGRIQEVSSGFDALAGLTRTASDVFGVHGQAVEKVTDSYRTMGEAQQAANDNTSSSTALWITAGTALAGFVVIMGAGLLATYKFTEAMIDGATAAGKWLLQLSTADLAGRFTTPALAAAKAAVDLGRELGVGAEALARIGAVSRDFGVSQDQASAAMKRMVAVLDQANTSTVTARQVLEDYGIQVKNLSGDQWALAIDKFAVALTGIKDSGQKTRDVIAVLGSDGPKWLAGIADGGGCHQPSVHRSRPYHCRGSGQYSGQPGEDRQRTRPVLV